MVKIYIINKFKKILKINNKKNILLLDLKTINTPYYSLYNKYKYIKYNQINKFKKYYISLNYKHSSIKKNINVFNLTYNCRPNIKIKNVLYNKLLFVEDNLNKKTYKMDYIPSNTLVYNTHKQFIVLNKIYYNNNVILNNIYNNKIRFNLNKINRYYILWGNNSYVYKYTILNGFKVQNSKKNISTKVKDITTGLSSIEEIFEIRSTLNSFILPPTITVLNKSFYIYEEISLSYLHLYSLFNLQNKTTVYLNNITRYPKLLYEQISSILLPQYNIISTNFSINIILSKLYSIFLDFYTQEYSTYLSHLYVYNLIVESLTKQYYKNNILIPSIQFEIIAKKMTSFVSINYIGDSSLNEKDIFDFNLINILNTTYNLLGYSQLFYTPIVLGISKSILASSGFLVSISFQEILKNIINLSICSSID